MNESTHKTRKAPFHYPEIGVGYFWPFGLMSTIEAEGMEALSRNLEFMQEVERTQVVRPAPEWATANRQVLELHTLRLRDFSTDETKEIRPTLVLPPYAGHTSVIADFHRGQSLMATLLDNGLPRVLTVDWKSATAEMRDYDVDNYLAEVNICVDDRSEPVNLIGLCQGGWLAAMYAARYPHKVATLVLAGSPIDTSAGESAIKDYAHRLPLSFFQELVAMGGGILKGRYMLRGFKNMHPGKQYFEKYVELYEHIEESDYVNRFESFERWYEYTIDLPGRWYLQVISQLFKENRFFEDRFVGLGCRLSLRHITCPVYLLAGKDDDITPPQQVFAARERLGTAIEQVVTRQAPGGHIGLFMGRRTLTDVWPEITAWIQRNGRVSA